MPRLPDTLASNPIWQPHNRITKAGPLANQSHASPQSSGDFAARNKHPRTSPQLVKPLHHDQRSRGPETTPTRTFIDFSATFPPSGGVFSIWGNSEGQYRPQGRREPPTRAELRGLKVPPQVLRGFTTNTDGIHASPHKHSRTENSRSTFARLSLHAQWKRQHFPQQHRSRPAPWTISPQGFILILIWAHLIFCLRSEHQRQRKKK